MFSKFVSKTLIRSAVRIICAALILAITACTQAPGEQTPPPVTASPIVTIDPSPSTTLSTFSNFLTEDGTGLVRDVETSPIQPELVIGDSTLDIRWLDCPKDLNKIDIQKILDAFPYVDFNTDTVWPEDLPVCYDPSAIMEAGKNPGLGVRSLHEQDITGKGVSIAIFDQTLLTGHSEYKDNLALLYSHTHWAAGSRQIRRISFISCLSPWMDGRPRILPVQMTMFFTARAAGVGSPPIWRGSTLWPVRSILI